MGRQLIINLLICIYLVRFIQYLQSKRISRDLNDVQAIMNLLKETMVNHVEEKSLMSISSGKSATDKIKDFLDKVYHMGKEAMEHLIDCRIVTL